MNLKEEILNMDVQFTMGYPMDLKTYYKQLNCFLDFHYQLLDVFFLELIKKMKEKNPSTKSLLLTGYGNIATAVAAIKSGAIDYLPKPAEVDQIYDALTSSKDILPPPPENPMTADRIRWEHIQRVFIQCNRNVSETARRLRMHRRTLQRILNKHAPKE